MMADGVEAVMNFRDGATPEIRRREMMGDRRQAGGRGASSNDYQVWSLKSVRITLHHLDHVYCVLVLGA